MKCFLRVVIVTCIAAFSVTAKELTLEAHKRTYDLQSERIDSECTQGLASLLDAYGKAIDGVINMAQQRGELDILLAAKDEKTRFDKQRSVPRESTSHLPAAVQRFRNTYHEACAKLQDTRARKTGDLLKKYISALDVVVRESTRSGKLDDALAAREEKRKVEFILADLEAGMKPPTPSPAPPKPPVRKPPMTSSAGRETTIDLGGGVKLAMVWIPPGSFRMGSPDNEAGRNDDEGPVHSVTISKGFWMGKYEVTQAQWNRVMDKNPSRFQGANNPTEKTSWHDCREFIEKLNNKVSGSGFRLPTEAEWEYACRAGTATRYYAGNSENDLATVGWYSKNSGKSSQAVGQKKPNAWGLYDMHGNVCEICSDLYSRYSPKTVTDPMVRAAKGDLVLRGGSWRFNASDCRSAYRRRCGRSYRNNYLGLRLVRTDGK